MPAVFPGPPSPPKVVSASKDCITLSWAPPTSTAGSRLLGYSLERRKKGSNLWSAVGDLIKGHALSWLCSVFSCLVSLVIIIIIIIIMHLI